MSLEHRYSTRSLRTQRVLLAALYFYRDKFGSPKDIQVAYKEFIKLEKLVDKRVGKKT